MGTAHAPESRLSHLFDVARDGASVEKKAAREKLAAALYDRTARMVGAMLRDFPVVQQKRSVLDINQDLWVRLLVALDHKVSANTTAEFLRIAATRLSQLLIDEANKYRGRVAANKRRHPHGDGQTVPMGQLEGPDSGAPFAPPAPDSQDPAALAEWVEFHQRLAALPADEREVVHIRFYTGATNKEAADALGLTEKQASRLWLAACQTIAEFLPKFD